MSGTEDDLDAAVMAVMRIAADYYGRGLRGQPFIFTIGAAGVVAHPVVVALDPDALRLAAGYGPAAVEQIALRAARAKAASLPQIQVAAVGYLFPAVGDFPPEADELIARWLRSSGGGAPWESEGVVAVVDGPGERRTYAALVRPGRADLGPPERRPAPDRRIPHLYPWSAAEAEPPGGFC